MSVNSAPSADHESADYRIAVFSVQEDPEPLQLAIMALPEMDRATANLQSHQLPGILNSSYDRETAVSLADAIQRLGLQASAVPVGEIPDIVHVHQTHHVQLTDDSLEAMDTSEHLQACAWSAISVISVGVLPSSAPAGFHAPPTLSSGSSRRTWNEGVRVSAKHRPEAYVILSDGQPGLLLASDEMNYEYLGDRMSTSSGSNFKLLIQDLVSRATGAWVTPSTLAFLEHVPVPRSEFRSHEEFRRYTEFQTLLSRRHMKHP